MTFGPSSPSPRSGRGGLPSVRSPGLRAGVPACFGVSDRSCRDGVDRPLPSRLPRSDGSGVAARGAATPGSSVASRIARSAAIANDSGSACPAHSLSSSSAPHACCGDRWLRGDSLVTVRRFGELAGDFGAMPLATPPGRFCGQKTYSPDHLHPSGFVLQFGRFQLSAPEIRIQDTHAPISPDHRNYRCRKRLVDTLTGGPQGPYRRISRFRECGADAGLFYAIQSAQHRRRTCTNRLPRLAGHRRPSVAQPR